MSAIVLQTAFLGDMILTTPLLDRLASEGPVDVVATPASAGLLINHPSVRDVIVYDKRGADRGTSGFRRIAARVRATRARTAYLAQGSLRTAALARVAGIAERVGFDTSPGRLLYSRKVSFRRDLHHAARLWMLAASEREEPPPGLRPTLYPGDSEHAAVDALLLAGGIAGGIERGIEGGIERGRERATPLVVLAPGSVWATKRWPFYDALAERLVHGMARSPARIVVLGAAGDRALAQAIGAAVARAGGAPVIDATGALSLLGSAALLSRARVLVTNDSAPLHLASAMNTPTVALFGPTVPKFGFGPLADRREVLGLDALPCRPCDAHGPQACPLGHWKCMRELNADSVAGAVARLATEE